MIEEVGKLPVAVDEEKGLNPRPTFCYMCGGPSDMVSIGIILCSTLKDGTHVYYNKDDLAKVLDQLKITEDAIESTREVEDGEKIPSVKPCAKCEAGMAEDLKIVQAGGIFWECSVCTMYGSMVKSEYTDKVRAHVGVFAPEPCLLKFDDCESHEREFGIKRNIN